MGTSPAPSRRQRVLENGDIGQIVATADGALAEVLERHAVQYDLLEVVQGMDSIFFIIGRQWLGG